MRLRNAPAASMLQWSFPCSSAFSTWAAPAATVPVTVLSGFLGAGKTTLLNHILSEKNHEKRIAVLVNDMAEINIDADLVRDSSGDKDMVQLENGCICCTLRDDLVIQLAGLAQNGDLDHILVESTGISEPHPVAQTFSMPISNLANAVSRDEEGDIKRAALADATAGLDSLQDVAHLNSLVTVVDCATFLEHIHSIETLRELEMSSTPEDIRPLCYLLMEQVQFANVLVLNKIDLVTPEESQKVEQFLTLLNPSANILRTMHSVVDASSLLSERRYDESQFNTMPAWAEELAKGPHRDSEADEYGIHHFTLRVLGRPFHAERWFNCMQDRGLFEGVLRAKGCFWTREEPNTRLDYSVVGLTGNLIVNRVWVQAGLEILGDMLEKQLSGAGAEGPGSIEQGIGRLQREGGRLKEASLWHPTTHDRRVELVFIGDETMQKEAIRDAVEAAMLTKEELRAFLDSWEAGEVKQHPNPFANVPRCNIKI